MWSALNIFRSKPRIECPPIGQLKYDRGLWNTRNPPPPIDSRGLLSFDAGPDGPSKEQLDAFQKLAEIYDAFLPHINEIMSDEYQAARSGYDLLPGTRLLEVGVKHDCSIFLSYGLYYYHKASKSIDMLDHEIVVAMLSGQVTDVIFVG